MTDVPSSKASSAGNLDGKTTETSTLSNVMEYLMALWLLVRQRSDNILLFISVLLYYLDIVSDIQTIIIIFYASLLGSGTFIGFVVARIVLSAVFLFLDHRRATPGAVWYECPLALVELHTLWLYHHRHDKGRLTKLLDSTLFELLIESSPLSVLQCVLIFMVMELNPGQGGFELAAFISFIISLVTTAFNSTQEVQRRMVSSHVDKTIAERQWMTRNDALSGIGMFLFFLGDGIMRATSFASLAGSLHLLKRIYGSSSTSNVSTLLWFFIMASIYMVLVFVLLVVAKHRGWLQEKLRWSHLLMQVGASVIRKWSEPAIGRLRGYRETDPKHPRQEESLR